MTLVRTTKEILEYRSVTDSDINVKKSEVDSFISDEKKRMLKISNKYFYIILDYVSRKYPMLLNIDRKYIEISNLIFIVDMQTSKSTYELRNIYEKLTNLECPRKYTRENIIDRIYSYYFRSNFVLEKVQCYLT